MQPNRRGTVEPLLSALAMFFASVSPSSYAETLFACTRVVFIHCLIPCLFKRVRFSHVMLSGWYLLGAPRFILSCSRDDLCDKLVIIDGMP